MNSHPVSSNSSLGFFIIENFFSNKVLVQKSLLLNKGLYFDTRVGFSCQWLVAALQFPQPIKTRSHNIVNID